MKRVIMYQTMDGHVHRDEHTAKRHADTLYGSALTLLAGKLAVIDKYIATADFIDSNLNAFVSLKALKDDMLLDESNSDED